MLFVRPSVRQELLLNIPGECTKGDNEDCTCRKARV